jgi:hypothetical protein
VLKDTSVTNIDLRQNGIDASGRAIVDTFLTRNKGLRKMFLFDARQMLLSAMNECADESSVVWPYLLESGDTDGIVAPDNVETLRAEFAAFVEERRRRAAPAARLVAADVDEGGSQPAAKRRRTNR